MRFNNKIAAGLKNKLKYVSISLIVDPAVVTMKFR